MSPPAPRRGRAPPPAPLRPTPRRWTHRRSSAADLRHHARALRAIARWRTRAVRRAEQAPRSPSAMRPAWRTPTHTRRSRCPRPTVLRQYEPEHPSALGRGDEVAGQRGDRGRCRRGDTAQAQPGEQQPLVVRGDGTQRHVAAQTRIAPTSRRVRVTRSASAPKGTVASAPTKVETAASSPSWVSLIPRPPAVEGLRRRRWPGRRPQDPGGRRQQPTTRVRWTAGDPGVRAITDPSGLTTWLGYPRPDPGCGRCSPRQPPGARRVQGYATPD